MTLAWPVVPFFPWWFKSGLEKQRCFNSFHFLSCSGVFFPLHFLLHLKKHKPQNILPAAQATTDQRIPRNGFRWERNTCIFYVAVANRGEFRAERQVWEACSVAWEGIVSHYHSSLNPRHCPANRNVEGHVYGRGGLFNLPPWPRGFWFRRRQELYRIPRIQLVHP